MPRAVALDLIGSVLEAKRPLDEGIESHPRMAQLSPRDRAFARNLAATTLRRLGEIDAVIGTFLERPLTGKGKPALDLLRLGACQLLFLKTPPHAAVATSVDLAGKQGLGPYKRLVNAILRRTAREGAAVLARSDPERLDTPGWLWDAWRAAYGEETCRAIARAHLAEAPLDLTVKADPERWSESLGGTLLPTGTIRIRDHRGPIERLAGSDDGAWWVQDAAAALPARLIGATDGMTVIDLCAAPGGKTAQLAASGAKVTAVDRSKVRLDRLRSNLQRAGLTARVIAADAARWRPEAPADAVLLDAPCTATGTIRRHPDIPRLKSPDDVRVMAKLQESLLAAAIEMVRPGGRIVYSVCSLQPREGPERIAALLAAGAPVEPEPIEAEDIGGIEELLDGNGAVRTLPCNLGGAGGMDGFFMARLRRR